MTLAEIYQTIDEPGFLPSEEHQNKVIPLFKNIRDGNNLESQPELATIAQIEIDVQSFRIEGNRLVPVFTGTDKQGSYHEYPSLQSWTDDDYRHLIDRQNQTGNPFLKATYSHVLWLSPKKHLKFALDALTAYREILDGLEAGGSEHPHQLKHFLSNAFHLAASTGNKGEIELAKASFSNMIRGYPSRPDMVFVSVGLIGTMLDNPKVFKPHDFADLDGLCLGFSQGQTSLHSRITILEMAERVSKKLGKNTVVYLEQIAKIYEDLSHQREDETKLTAMKFCQDAIEHYRLAKNQSKVKELEGRYRQLKQDMKMGKIGYEVDLTEAVKKIRIIANEVLSHSPDYILQFLMYSPEVFPSYRYLHDEAVKSHGEFLFHSMMGKTIYDDFGHPAAHYNEEAEKIHFSIMESLRYSTRMVSLVLLREIVLQAVDTGKLSAPIFLNFLKKSSWLGQDISIVYKYGERKRYNWLDLLSPGINDFFSQLYFLSLNPINIPNFVLAIDSLSLKVEGILRDMCALRGGITFFQTDDGQGRSVMREKDINALLRDPEIMSTLNEDDLMLLQFLLVDKVGLNLRNRVAHSLIREVDGYGFQYMLLLIAMILRLAKNEYAPPTRDDLAE